MKNQKVSKTTKKSAKPRRNRGVILILACASVPLIMGMLGLAVDLSIMYAIKSRLQMACDGAALAALRSISLAQTVSSQQTMATSIAQNWFRANFADNFMGATNTSSPPTVSVSQDTVNFITKVSVTASTDSPSYFMKWFSRGATTLPASGEAARRNVVITLVLDRSGSMGSGSSSPCEKMKAAAKQFTGAFVPTRDYIGMVTFAETVHVALSPTTDFQSALGYTNASGSATGAIDNISCTGGTNTSSGISVAWNENYKMQLPGALNVLVLMTDGQPTAGTFKFVTTNPGRKWPNNTSDLGTANDAFLSSSTCRDSASVALSAGGNMWANPTNWIDASQKWPTTSGTNQIALGTNSYANWTPIFGPVGALYATNYGVEFFWAQNTSYSGENNNYTSQAPGCAFTGTDRPYNDIAFVPPVDIFGSSSTGYKTGMVTSNILGTSRIVIDSTNGANNLAKVMFNLADNAATFARTSNTLTNGNAYLGNQIFTIGLGGNGGVDHTLLQRIANDPNQSDDGGVTYAACGICTTARGPLGMYLYAPTANDLGEAFANIASQILRLSR